MLEFGGMSREVRDLYFDVHLYCDAMVGYTSWYLRKKMPKVPERAFLPRNIWARIKSLELSCKSDADRDGVKGAKELTIFVENLTNLMFFNKKGGKP